MTQPMCGLGPSMWPDGARQRVGEFARAERDLVMVDAVTVNHLLCAIAIRRGGRRRA